jgi:hypothetical protein
VDEIRAACPETSLSVFFPVKAESKRLLEEGDLAIQVS